MNRACSRLPPCFRSQRSGKIDLRKVRHHKIKLFWERDSDGVQAAAPQRLRTRIEGENQNYLLNVNEKDYIDHLVSEVQIEPLVIDFDGVHVSFAEKQIQHLSGLRALAGTFGFLRGCGLSWPGWSSSARGQPSARRRAFVALLVPTSRAPRPPAGGTSEANTDRLWMAFQIRSTAVARSLNFFTFSAPGRLFQISTSRAMGQLTASLASPAWLRKRCAFPTASASWTVPCSAEAKRMLTTLSLAEIIKAAKAELQVFKAILTKLDHR